MDIYWLFVAFFFGAIVGSFLNVVIYRLHTGKSLRGRSHCLSCGKGLAWFELVPLLSYVFLRAKCRNCLSYIPSRYFVVELLTAVSFTFIWYFFSYDLVLVALYALLASALIVVAVYDIRHTIIPDELSVLIGGIAVLYVGYAVYLTHDYGLIASHFLSGVAALFFIGSLWYLSKGKWMGLGDAKLALPLCAIVGFPGVFSVIVFSFWIGAVVAVTLLALQSLIGRGKTRLRYRFTPITMKSEVPFAPFLILGFLLVHFLHADVFDITFRLFFSF
jgi:leader peptidase (prepilin peptidase)/N-methyltransferase